MARYIDADALKNDIENLPTYWADAGGYYGGAQPPMEGLLEPMDVLGTINAQPTADVKPVVRGKNLLPCAFECDQCGFKTEYHGFEMYFCPNCGADMRGEKNDL